jgi:Alpha-(1,6)-fucosyltransferase N- and catalytic domains
MWNSGWGADLSNVVDGIQFAHRNNKPFEISTDDTVGWHYAAKKDGSKPTCPQKNLQCYFLNTTRCDTHKRPINPRQSFLAGPWPGFHKTMDYVEYLVRPQTWLRKRVYEFSKPYRLGRPCAVLHVRRGDVVLLDPTPRRYHAIEEYMEESHSVTQNILLLTDDHNAIGEALYKYPQYRWVYLNRTRYKGPEGGWEEHIPSDSPEQEVVALLSGIRLARTCDKLIHSKSNLADYIYAAMKANHAKVQRINLDEGQKNVHYAENVHSVNLSIAYN